MKTRMLVRRLLASMAAAAYVGVSTGASAAAPASPVGLSGDIMTVTSPASYESQPGSLVINNTRVPLVLKNVSYAVVPGVLQSNGIYSYPYTLTTPPGRPLAAIEVAVNPSSHTQLIEVGNPTSASLRMVPPGSGGTSGTVASAPSASTPATTTLTQAKNTGSYKVVWHDPLNLEMATVQDTITFIYDGAQVDSYTGADSVWWAGDGWSLLGQSTGSYYNSSHSQATVWTNAGFVNPYFGNLDPACVVHGNTYIYVDDNNVVASANGDVSGYVNTYAAGGCYGYLGYYTILN